MVSEEFSLSERIALVAGDSPYNKTLALSLARAGADVFVAAKNAKSVDEITGEIRRLGRRATGSVTNITDFEETEGMVGEAISEFGRIDILMNCGGFEFAKPFLKVTEEDWHRAMDVNLTSVFHCCKAVGKQMLRQKKGKIISLVSGLAIRGLPNSTAACASMGAVLQLTKALAIEWAREGIRVNALGLGWFSEEATSQDEAQRDPFLRYIPLGRRGVPADLEALAVYLASDAADFITGQVVFAAGGVTARV